MGMAISNRTMIYQTHSYTWYMGQLNFFHNTINLLPSQVRVEEKRNIAMGEAILMLLKAHPERWFSPWEVCELFDNRFLIGSIRRAMTDFSSDEIESKNKLVKSTWLVMERKGKPNYQWKIK